MNLIPTIREALGLEENEQFRLNDINGGTYTSVYRFTDDDFQVREIQGWNDVDSLTLKLILIGKREIIKLPFKPNEYEAYYFVNLHFGTVEVSAFSKDFTADVIRVNSGNCYLTREEAENHVDEWMTKVYGKDWRKMLEKIY